MKIAGVYHYISNRIHSRRSANQRRLMDIQSIPGIEKLTRAEQGIIACIDSTCTRAFVDACQERDRAFYGAREEGRARISRALETRIDALSSARIVHAERVRRLRTNIAKKPGFLNRVLDGIPMLENIRQTENPKKEESGMRLSPVPIELAENDLITAISPNIDGLINQSNRTSN